MAGNIDFVSASSSYCEDSYRLHYITYVGEELKTLLVKTALKQLGYPLETAFKYQGKKFNPFGLLNDFELRELEDDQYEAIETYVETFTNVTVLNQRIKMAAVRLLNKAETSEEKMLIVHDVHQNCLPNEKLKRCQEAARPEFLAMTDFIKMKNLTMEMDTMYLIHGGML